MRNKLMHKLIIFSFLSLALTGCIQKKVTHTYGPYDCDHSKKIKIEETYLHNRLEGPNTKLEVKLFLDQKLVAKNTPSYLSFLYQDIQKSYDLTDKDFLKDDLNAPLDLVAESNDPQDYLEASLCFKKNIKLIYSKYPGQPLYILSRIVVLKK